MKEWVDTATLDYMSSETHCPGIVMKLMQRKTLHKQTAAAAVDLTTA